MIGYLRDLLSGNQFAPHGYCLLWQPELVWTHVVSDVLIAAAYFSIPVALVHFVRRRKDVTFSWVFWSFALFILACGATHVMHVWNLWNGHYGTEAIVKMVTAAASVFTAVAIWPLIPKVLAFPSSATLRQANAELAARIRERDEALERLRLETAERKNAEEQLLRVQKLNALGQLAGGVAHDFNNLLQAVRGNLDLMIRKADDPARVRHYAESGLQATDRGAKLTSQLLAFSRTQKLELKPVVVASLIEGMQDLLSRTLGPSIGIRLHLDSGRTSVLCDPTQLELAILNLCLNARDAMPDGGDLTINSVLWQAEKDPELGSGKFVRVDVKDTGSGMDAETIARVFEPFFTTKPLGKGTGLGLSMVYGLAQQSGGTVRIDSALGRGTTVSLLLRCAADLAPAEQVAAVVAGQVPQAARAATILVVDDDEDVRAATVSALESLGYHVVAAPDGVTALERLAASQPDLVLLDFAMPGMSGAQVAEAIRARSAKTPIVFSSGFADTDALLNAVGADAVTLRKPYSLHELASVIAVTLNEAPARRLRESVV